MTEMLISVPKINNHNYSICITQKLQIKQNILTLLVMYLEMYEGLSLSQNMREKI